MRRYRIVSAGVVLCLLLTVALGGGSCAAEAGTAQTPPADIVIKNHAGVVRSLREGLRTRAAVMTVRFTCETPVSDLCDRLVQTWMEEALEETDHPAEGDYIRYQYGGYTYRASCDAQGTERKQYHYTIRIEPRYYSYLAWEEAVDAEIGRLMERFRFDAQTADAQKIKAIYDYVCENVSYDRVHAKNPHRTKCRTAYAALTLRTATCQGYCTLLYRLLREAGVGCRIVTGRAMDETLHAWVVAELAGEWYLLDPTWDAESEDGYRYYLIGTEEDGGRHIPGDAFRKEGFPGGSGMSEASYKGE